MKAALSIALLLTLAAGAMAGEERVQPLLLPMPELLRQLDAKEEWILLPLDEWRALRAADPVKELDPLRPKGAWIEGGHVRGELVDDGELRLTGELTIVAVDPAPSRVKLFPARPARLGRAELAGAPALLVPGDQGVDLLVPGPGRHALTLAWQGRLAGTAERTGDVVLPLAGGLDLLFTSRTPGQLAGPGLAVDGDGWRLARPAEARLPLVWHPGRLAAAESGALTVRQAVSIHLDAAGAATLRWSARLEAVHGSLPGRLTLRLPAGWRFTTPGAGVRRITGDEVVELDLGADARTVTCDGLAAAGSVIALPAIDGALTASGIVLLTADRAWDDTLPPGWRVEANEKSKELSAVWARRYAAPGPGGVLTLTPARDGAVVDARSAANLLIGPGVGDWTIVQMLEVAIPPSAVREVLLQVPAGWALTGLSPGPGVTVLDVAAGDVSDLPPGIRLTLRATGSDPARLRLDLARRDAAAPAALVSVVGAGRISQRLCLYAAPPLATVISAAAPWRLTGGDERGMRAELLATGEAPAIPVTVSERPSACTAEAVAWLLPAADGGWCRLDLRLTVRDGDLDGLTLAAPFAGEAPRCTSALMTCEKKGAALALGSRSRWRGEHLLRLEGRLQTGGGFPRLALTLPDGTPVPLRVTVALQSSGDADLVAAPGTAARTVDEDDLPVWTRSIPGAPVLGAWRIQGAGEAGGWTLVERAAAALPAGVVDALELRTQFDDAGMRTVLTARIAAPGLQALPLTLSPGWWLEDAAIDGVPVAVRIGPTGVVLPLPGRTQVRVALALRHVPPSAGVDIPLPRLGDLPVTRSAWYVALPADWRVIPSRDPGAMPLAADTSVSHRPWFGSWRPAGTAVDIPALLPLTNSGSGDGRALVSAAPPASRPSEPGIALRGQLWTGSRTGAPERLTFGFSGIDRLAAWDRIGRLLAALTAIVIIASARWRIAAALALMAWPLAAALHAWGLTAGPLLAFSEWLPPTMAGAAVLRWLIIAMRRPALVTALFAVAIGAGGITGHAGDSPVLMGYDHIDADGLPQAVRVALTRAQLTRLWQRAHPEVVTAAPVCALATGVPRIALTLAGSSLSGELRLPCAVLSKDWQTVRLPALAAAARAVTLAGLAGAPVPAGALAWRADGLDLVVSLAGGTQAEVVVALALPLVQSAGTWTATMTLPSGLGGRVRLSAPTTDMRRPVMADGRMHSLDTDPTGWHWTTDIDPGVPHWTVVLLQPQDAQRHDAGLSAEQQVRAVLDDGRISWSAELALTIRGEARRTLTVELPAGLTLATVTGNGVAGWRQEGAGVVVSFTAPVIGPQALTLTGLIPRGVGEGQAALLLRLPGATVGGRLDLTHGADVQFVRPAGGAWERTDPLPGSDLAMRVAAAAVTTPTDLPPIAWQPQVAQLGMEIDAAAMVGIDHLRVVAALKLSGRGAIDSLNLALPTDWRVTAPGLTLSESANGAERVFTVRRAGPWKSGDVAVLVLDRERAGIGARITLPEFPARRAQLHRGRVVWVVGDAGDRRVRLVDGAATTPRDPLAVANGLTRSGATLRAGEQWRLAFEQREPAPLTLELAEAESPLHVEASHYLVVGQERVRWWSRLVCQPGDGRVSEVRCTLPTAAQVVRVQAGGLGSWSRDGDVLLVRLAAPTRQPVTLELDLEQALSEGRALIHAPQVAGGIASQRVALVDEDGLGLLHLDPEGLEPDDSVGGLPAGIDAAHITKRWRAVRPAWQVAVRREAVATSIGVDGVATLVDVFSVIAGDGESRARATWHVLNRTRHQLPLVLPAGVELWEARLDGRVVRPRIGDDGRTWLPVHVQRPGEAALRVSLTWRERLTLGSTVPGMPRIDGLRVQRVLWRFAPSPELAISYRGGDLRTAGAGEAETDRARCVVDELTRLRALTGLGDAGLARLADQLTALDLELDDYQMAMRRLGVDGGPLTPAAQVETSSFVGVVDANKSQVQQELKRIGGEVGNRANRRRALGLTNLAQRWQPENRPVVNTEDGYLPDSAPTTLPWRSAATVAAGDTLGVGEPPPGLRAASATGMLGVDLLGDAPPVGLVLRGDGGGMDVRLSLKRTGGSWVPWLGLFGGALAAALALMRLRRE